jgi:hypothetical protein
MGVSNELSGAKCESQTTRQVTPGRGAATARARALPLPAAIAVWALACGTYVTATPINPAPRPLTPRSPESVEVFASGPPSEPFVDIALLEVTQHEGLNRQGLDFMIERLRKRGGELGCDAVFIKGVAEHKGDDRALAILDPDARQLFASCLVYTHQQPAMTPAPTSSGPPPRRR